ncbi:MAG: hypothetical protein KDA87_21970, partial [Planctomycetales bacterium]|nr:hypothetical protein [Planctomycetales bacterium]
MRLSSKFTLIFVYLVFLGRGVGTVQADGPSDNLPDQVRRIPQLGIDVPDNQRQQLQAELKALEVDL